MTFIDLSMLESNTSEIETDAISAVAKPSISLTAPEDRDHCDLFERVHTLNQARKSVLVPKNTHQRVSTMGGYVVNQTTLLRFYMDEQNYTTIPIHSGTKAMDAIESIIYRRQLPHTTQCTLYQDNQKIDPQANLHEIMNISSGARIEVRFTLHDDNINNIDKDHHLIKALTPKRTQSHEYTRKSDLSQKHRYNSAPYKYDHHRPQWRAFPNKLNLIAFNAYSIQHSDESDVCHDEILGNIENRLKQIQRQQFSVIKINKYNKHQKRVLKLTEHGIENIKPRTSGLFHSNDECVTSFHSWENITNAYLEDSKTIRISYSDYKDGDRRYQSPVANDINEWIQKRLKIIRDEKTSSGRQEISIKFQKKLLHAEIASHKIYNLGDDVMLTRNRSGHIVYKGFVHFAPGAHYGIQLANDDGDHDGLYEGIRYFQTDAAHAVIVPESHIIRKTIVTNKQKHKFPSFNEENEQLHIGSPFLNGGVPSSAKISSSGDAHGGLGVHDLIFGEIKAMILSTETLEGRYRLNFANQFDKYAKEDNLLELVREFMDAVKSKIDSKHAEKYKKWITNSTTDDKLSLHRVSDVCNTLIESAIEQTILQTKIKEIYGICLNETQSQTQILSLKIDKLRHRNQQYFGIKTELESTSNWNRAVYELTLLNDCCLPSEKIRSLVNCAHAIYLSHAKEQKEKYKAKAKFNHVNDEYFITGDDFLPIVIYVIVQASNPKPCITDADLTFMEGLVDPAVNRSEGGYYLAVFHAALQWIRCFNN
eukprot:161197_1